MLLTAALRGTCDDRRMIEVIAFDADDTLWHQEALFAMTHERFRDLVAPYSGASGEADLDARLFATETANLKLFGYGVKAFTLSMIETAIELSAGRIPAYAIKDLIDAGKDILAHPVELLDGVRETVELLAARGDRRLMLITKGDLFHQESKLAASGLGEYFWRVAVVAEKDAATYLRVLTDHGVDPATFLMIGNSVPSDVLPVIEIGGRAVHVPSQVTWAREAGDPVTGHDRVWNLARLDELPRLLSRLDASGEASRDNGAR
jgi:putative hydrolase of the HAD superfamily